MEEINNKSLKSIKQDEINQNEQKVNLYKTGILFNVYIVS